MYQVPLHNHMCKHTEISGRTSVFCSGVNVDIHINTYRMCCTFCHWTMNMQMIRFVEMQSFNMTTWAGQIFQRGQ